MPSDSLTPLEAFVPALIWPGRRPTMAELATWHEALSDAVGQLMPVDLMACWLLPSRGGSVLVGPPGLAPGAIPIPPAEPIVAQEGLFELEDRLRASGYHSVLAVPVRAEVQDVGLLVVGRFGEVDYTLDHQRTLHRVAAHLATPMRRLAAQPWITPAAASEERTPMVAGITEALLDAVDQARSGSDLAQLVSDAIGVQLPHDRLDILAVAPAPDCWAMLGTDGITGRTLQIDATDLDRVDALIYHLGGEPTARIADLREVGLQWPGSFDGRNADRQRALLAARMEVGGELVGWLWLGSSSPGWFQETDQEVARLAARLLASRVATWAARHELAGAWNG